MQPGAIQFESRRPVGGPQAGRATKIACDSMGDSIEVFLEDFEGITREQVVKILEMSKNLIESSTNILNENFA